MRRGTTTLTVVIALGLVLATTHPALASVSIKQVSVTRRGGDPAGGGTYSSESANGRYVAFTSRAGGDLVADDHTSQLLEVFVRDVVNGTTVRASVDAGDGDPDSDSSGPSISADGRYVAFISFASDLVQGDRNGSYDVFVRDLVSGTTVRASVDAGGGDPDSGSIGSSISADGRYVAIMSSASDLVPGDGNGTYDIFVRDLVTETTIRASVNTVDGDSNGLSLTPSISGDGRYVAFESTASNLIHGDRNNDLDVFVRDLVAGNTHRAGLVSRHPSLSADGRYVAFSSRLPLVPEDENGTHDVFVRDLMAGTIVRASVDLLGGDPNKYSLFPSISADGRFVAFQSGAGDLVAGDHTNHTPDVL